MKKSFLSCITMFLMVIFVFAREPNFNLRTGGYNLRLYDYSEYIDGNYRSNFVSIPQNRMLNYMDGFKWKVGVFILDGNTLYLGWNDTDGNLQLCDENKNFYITSETYKTQETSIFRYGQNQGDGIVTQINLNGKNYTIAVAGISSNKAEIYSDSSGFRMWVENEAAKDAASSKTVDNWVNYNFADIMEGVYKPGWKRLWGKIEEGTRNYRYTYKGEEFVCIWDNYVDRSLKNTDGTVIPIKNDSGAHLIWYDDKPNYGYGMGIEADVQIGKNKVRMAYFSCDGEKRVFVKDTTGYPVLQTKNAPVKKIEKVKPAKSSGKAANFIRDYETGKRVYSKDDISQNIYKTNYRNIPQQGTTSFGITWTSNDGTEKKEYKINAGLFDIGVCQVAIYYHSDLSWDIIPYTEQNRVESWKLNRTGRFAVEDCVAIGTEAQILRSGKVIDTVAIIPVDLEKGYYKLFVKTGPNEETSLSEKDNYGFEYFDPVDLDAGVYKPGFEAVPHTAAKEDSYKRFFEGSKRYDRVELYDYYGTKFLIGPTQDPATAVKNLDGSVIHNPENQIRLKYVGNGKKIELLPGLYYGWEGKVKIGDKDVILAVLKWDYNVYVFIKENK